MNQRVKDLNKNDKKRDSIEQVVEKTKEINFEEISEQFEFFNKVEESKVDKEKLIDDQSEYVSDFNFDLKKDLEKNDSKF